MPSDPIGVSHVDKAADVAYTKLWDGMKPQAVEEHLVATGVDAAMAHTLVHQVDVARRANLRKAAERQMLVGGLWCVGGIVVTAVTYSAASGQGGTYVVAWGAIIFGGIQFIGGLAQYMRTGSGALPRLETAPEEAAVELVEPELPESPEPVAPVEASVSRRWIYTAFGIETVGFIAFIAYVIMSGKQHW